MPFRRLLAPTVAASLVFACGPSPATPAVSGTPGLASATAGVSAQATASATAGSAATPARQAASPDLTHWARIDSVEQPEGFMRVHHDGNGKPVLSCTPCHPAVDTIMTDVADGPAGLVAVGYVLPDFNGAAWWSADGSHWTLESSAFSGISMLTSVAADARTYVAIGRADEGSTAWHSSDGRNWTRAPGGEAFAATPLRIQSVASWTHGFAAVGYAGTEFGRATAAFLVSPDGVTWTRAPDSAAFGDARAWAVAANGSGLVAVGNAGEASAPGPAIVWTSTDGLHWDRVADDPVFHDGRMRSVAAVAGIGVVAAGENLAGSTGIVWISSDGRAWRRATPSDVLGRAGIQVRVYDVIVSSRGIIAVGVVTEGIQYGTASVWSSPDGNSWTLEPTTAALSDGEINAVGAFGSRLVGVGDRGAPDAYIAQVWESPVGWWP